VERVGEMKAEELMKFRNWIVAGDVMDEMKYAGRIFNKLKRKGYNVIGLHPLDSSPEVYKKFDELAGLAEKFEVLNLVVNPVRGLEITMEARKYGINKVLAQPGARSDEIRTFCEKNHMDYIEGCTLVELNNL